MKGQLFYTKLYLEFNYITKLRKKDFLGYDNKKYNAWLFIVYYGLFIQLSV